MSLFYATVICWIKASFWGSLLSWRHLATALILPGMPNKLHLVKACLRLEYCLYCCSWWSKHYFLKLPSFVVMTELTALDFSLTRSNKCNWLQAIFIWCIFPPFSLFNLLDFFFILLHMVIALWYQTVSSGLHARYSYRLKFQASFWCVKCYQ